MFCNHGHLKVFVTGIGLFILFSNALFGNVDTERFYQLDETVVTASRAPTAFFDLDRSVTVFTRDEIEAAPVNNVFELLEYVSSVDLKQRGPQGVQGDVSIRGSSFEQALILVDGIKVGDPQTGHHNLSLPINLSDVERVEVLKGHGSKLYGPNAFGGVINFITNRDAERELKVEAELGDYSSYSAGLSASVPFKNHQQRISLSKRKSDGYRYNTYFDILTLSYSSNYNIAPGNKVNFSVGYTDKDFGANDFYYENPDQKEHIKTGFIRAGANWEQGSFSLVPNVYYRYNEDDYFFTYNDAWDKNSHITDIYGAELQVVFLSKLGYSALGGELRSESIRSTQLGKHSRLEDGLFFEHRIELFDRLDLVSGGFATYYSDWGWMLWPGFDLGLRCSDKVRVYSSIGRAFRVPSYTELYYTGGGNEGNPDLRPEKSWTGEMGLRWLDEYFGGDITIFRREGDELIDWIRYDDSSSWEATNISELTVNGLEFNLTFNSKARADDLPFTQIRLGYTLLDSDKEDVDFQSKYILNYLHHQLILSLQNDLFFGFKQGWSFRFEDRLQDEGHFLADMKITYTYKKSAVFISVTNIFDTPYSETGSIPMPGRWVKAGLSYTIFGR